jgi:hypothetical protein
MMRGRKPASPATAKGTVADSFVKSPPSDRQKRNDENVQDHLDNPGTGTDPYAAPNSLLLSL